MEHIVGFSSFEDKESYPFIVELAGITEPAANYQIYRQDSDIYCIEYVISGKGIVSVDNNTCYPEAGDIYILPLGHKHNYRSDPSDPFKKIWMNVRGELCEMLFRTYDLERILIVHDLKILHLFEKFLSICENHNADTLKTFSECSIVFHEIVLAIYLHHKALNEPLPTIATQLKHYIDKNIFKDISVSELANFAHLSVSQVGRVFKQTYKISPYQYILNEKIERAKSLLVNTNLSIKEISQILGYKDEHYFSNAFKSKSGVAPSQWSGK